MKAIARTILGFAAATALLASPIAEAQGYRGGAGAPGFSGSRPMTPVVRPGPWVGGGGGWQGGSSGWVASPGWRGGAWAGSPGWRGGGWGWAGSPGWRGGWGWAGRPGWGWGWGGGWGWGWAVAPGWGWGWAGAPGWGWGGAPGWGWGGAPVVVAQQTFFPPFEQTVFIERETVVPEQAQAPALAPPVTAQPTSWWYWCASAQGYYPYVDQCPEAWQRIAPRTPPNTR